MGLIVVTTLEVEKVSCNKNISNSEIFVYTAFKFQTFQLEINNHAVDVNIKHEGVDINTVNVVIPPAELIKKLLFL